MSYTLHITSADPIGFGLLNNVIEAAALGAVLDPNTLPRLSFPQIVTMVSDVAPTPSATMRVFDADTKKEIFAAFAEPVAASFNMEVEPVDKSTNGGVPWTKEQLDAMDWETEFKEVCKSVDITGRSRDKMTKEYLAKFA